MGELTERTAMMASQSEASANNLEELAAGLSAMVSTFTLSDTASAQGQLAM